MHRSTEQESAVRQIARLVAAALAVLLQMATAQQSPLADPAQSYLGFDCNDSPGDENLH